MIWSFSAPALALKERRITDMAGRTVTISEKANRVIGSGGGPEPV